VSTLELRILNRPDGLHAAIYARVGGGYVAEVYPTASGAAEGQALVGWPVYLDAPTMEAAASAFMGWQEHQADVLGMLRRRPLHGASQATAMGALLSEELVEDLPRPYGTHWMEGRAFYADGHLAVSVVEGTNRAAWVVTRVRVVPEPGVLELPQPVLDALRGYAMDWPTSAQRIHWHERVGVPAIARIRHVACLLSHYRDEWEGFRDERDEDDWTAPAMARAGLVEPDPDPAVVAARVAAKWPGLWAKYAVTNPAAT